MSEEIFSGNRVKELFGIRYPIVQAGMIWCSGWELASAVSNSGGLGLIGSGSMSPDVLRIHIRKAKENTTFPFGVNVPLLYSHAEGNLNVVIEEGVKIVFTSAGNPKTWTQKLKDIGIKVVHVVSSGKFAKKSEDAGVDAIVAEGFEAGGHNGREETTTFCLIPQVREVTSLPLIAAGGIATGAGMLAAMALGAEGVQIGTRFVASKESSAHPAFKDTVINIAEDGTQLTLKDLTPVRMVKNKFFKEAEEMIHKGASVEELKNLLGRGRSRKGMFEGDLDEGELEIGQISGLLDEILTADEIMKSLIAEYQLIKKKIHSSENGF